MAVLVLNKHERVQMACFPVLIQIQVVVLVLVPLVRFLGEELLRVVNKYKRINLHRQIVIMIAISMNTENVQMAHFPEVIKIPVVIRFVKIVP